MAGPRATPGSVSNLALGFLGILGGTVLLVAFALDIPSDLNVLRLVLFNAGAIATVVAVHRTQVEVAPTWSLLAAIPAVLSNAWYLAMEVLSIGNPQPFAGLNGMVFFAAGVAMWLSDAAFGLVTLRIGLVARWGPLALAIGSALAITGMDRLELTAPDHPTIFGPLSLIGIALNGIGWIVVGLEVMTHVTRVRIAR
jgi:hypothetical protein